MKIQRITITLISLIFSSFYLFGKQPKITVCKWGIVIIDKILYKKDQIITPTKYQEWIFAPTINLETYPSKTQHGRTHPGDGGIAIADVKQIEDTANIIILSRGYNCFFITDLDLKKMKNRSNGTIKYLRDKGKTVYCLPTPDAVAKYKDLTRQGHKVAMLLHLTC